MCRVAKYVWSLVAFALGADNRPTSFEQYWLWIQRHLKNKKNMFTWWDCQLYAGPPGKQEMKPVLKKE